jgi:tape measure domain-containing protein
MELEGLRIAIDPGAAKQGSDQAVAAFDAVGKKSVTVSQQVTASFKQIGTGILSVRDAVFSLRTIAEGLAVSFGVEKIITQLQRVENIKISLTAVTGSSKAAADTWNYLEAQGQKLGFQADDLGVRFSRFLLTTRDTALEGERTRKVFEGIATAAKVLGGGTDAIDDVLQSFTLLMSRSNVDGEAMVRLLARRIPDAAGIAARALNVPVENLKQALVGISSQEFVAKFGEELTKEFSPFLEQSANSIESWKARLEDAFQNLEQSVGEGGFGTAIVDFLKQITELLKSPEANEAARQFGKLLAEGAMAAARALIFLGNHLGLVKTALVALAAVEVYGYLTRIMTAVNALSGAYIALRAAVLAYTTAQGVANATAGASSFTSLGRSAVIAGGSTAAVRGSGRQLVQLGEGYSRRLGSSVGLERCWRSPKSSISTWPISISLMCGTRSQEGWQIRRGRADP